MLVLTRRIGEEIVIGPDIRIMVCRIKGEKVSIGIDAPGSVAVDRREIRDLIEAEERRARESVNGAGRKTGETS